MSTAELIGPRSAAESSSGALLAAIVAWTARRGRLAPNRLLDLGLLYEVIVAFGIALGDNLTPSPRSVPWRRFPGSRSGS